MEEQLPVKAAEEKPLMTAVTAGMDKPSVDEGSDFTTIEGKGFSVKFDNRQGTINSLVYHGKEMIHDGEGPKIDALRAPVDNDNWAFNPWFANGLHNLKHKATAYKLVKGQQNQQTVQIMYTVESQAPNAAQFIGWNSGDNTIKELTNRPFGPDDFKFVTSQIWTVYPDGSIELQSTITSNNASLVLPRLGYVMELPSELSQYTYYGRGPWNNYNDRKTGSFIEMYQTTVKDQFVNFPKPQSMGNREQVRWCALTDGQGNGIEFVAEKELSASALPWSALEMTLAPHPYQLPKSTSTHLHLDAAVTGLGGNSCGQGGPLDPDRVKANNHTLNFIIRPVQQSQFTKTAQVATAGAAPLAVSRSRNGMVTISTSKPAAIAYTIDGAKKATDYLKPFDLRAGGTVKAFYKENPDIATTITFAKIESIPMEVVYASSQEGGEEAKYLVDGDINTKWHTMYSVTVAQYPHWVDFDAGEVKTIKGFVYTPRQDGPNGDIKDYSLQVSMDGKNWGDPVAKGAFKKSKDPQRVLLDKPVKARFIRFTGLNAQNGADFASGAEFSVIAE